MATQFALKRHPRWLKSVVLLSVFPFLISCIPGILPKIWESGPKTETHNFVFGTTLSNVAESKRVVVVAFTIRGGTYHYLVSQRVDEKNCFFFATPRNVQFGLAAFVDRNGNGRYDPGEPAGVPAESDGNLMLPESSVTNTRIILMPHRKIPAGVGQILALGGEGEGIPIPLHVGRVIKLDAAQFSPTQGSRERYSPFDAAVRSKVGVFFLEPYAPAKIPIVFVNGFGGCPQDWRFFVDRIDRQRFQPWFFYYPCGMRLHDAAAMLDESITVLHRQYRFNSLFVTAHSMGGLIARDFILRNLQRHEDYIKLYVSISTPWYGHESAEFGVKYAPSVVPSWIDMVPGSDFQRSLFARQLPPDVRYFLFFSYKGEGDDGVVSLASQLWPEAQKEAERVVGFNESHESILVSREALASFRQLLDEVAGQTAEKAP